MKALRATPAQINYLNILSNDLGYTLTGRKIYLMDKYYVHYFDELTIEQASELINQWKEDK